MLVRLPDVQRYSSLPSPRLQLLRLGLFFVCSSDTLFACALASVGQFLRLVFQGGFFCLGRSFPFPSLIGFFPSFCQALAEDRVTTPTKKKKKRCLPVLLLTTCSPRHSVLRNTLRRGACRSSRGLRNRYMRGVGSRLHEFDVLLLRSPEKRVAALRLLSSSPSHHFVKPDVSASTVHSSYILPH